MAVSPDDMRSMAPRPLAADRFAVRGLGLEYAAGPETIRWEVFQGRLLDAAQTRQVESFESWSVYAVEGGARSPEPLLSLKLGDGVVHVVRGVEGHVWEGHAGAEGIESRQVRKWVRELIASFALAGMDAGTLEEELTLALQRAVWGARLPLLPTEAPHPLFSFGRLAYAIDEAPDHRRIETWLRMLGPSPRTLAAAWREAGNTDDELYTALRRVFDDVSLSPWTDLVPRVLDAVEALFPPARVADFLASVALLVTRHLTAYDLITFHHRGANYPDALLLDELLTRLLRHVDHLATPRHRRALRQAWLLRREYENHPVPDVPTSPGELLRVYPGDHPRVPEEQLTEVGSRRRRLFSERLALSDTARALLRRSAEEGHEELGAAVYLDRPLGDGKQPVEPDGTPLVASLAYSRLIATRRWRLLAEELGLGDAPDLSLPGLPLEQIGPARRLGTVSLLDAARVSPDFVYRRTLPGGLAEFGVRGCIPALSLVWGGVHREPNQSESGDTSPHSKRPPRLLARAADGTGLVLYDETFTPIATLVPRYEEGYRVVRGVEWPAVSLK